MTDSDDPFADAIPNALKYHAQGWGIVPAYSPRLDRPPRADGLHPCSCSKGAACKSPGKHPAVSKEPNNAEGFRPYFLKDEASIRTALANPGTRNYGLVPPPGVDLLDLDGVGLQRWNALKDEIGSPGTTLLFRTPNGFHAAYEVADDPGGNLLGIVTRRHPGGLVIGPGSVHPSGKPYRNGGPTAIRPLPRPWLDAMAESARIPHNAVPVTDVPVGSRHQWLRDEALTYVDQPGMRQRTPDTEARLWAHVMAFNAALTPPKTPDEVRQAIGDPWAALQPHPTLTLNGSRAADGTGTVGGRTANDLPVGPPPALIAQGILLPDRTTMVYGPGGTGKGVIAVILAAILRRDHGLVVGVIDYEDHPEEWGSRLDGITFPDGTRLTTAEKAGILYRSPYDVDDWTADTGSLHTVAMALRADFDARGVQFLIVDSYSAATDGEEGMGGQRDAKNFAMGITKIGRPALVLAHVAGTGERLPDKPFGSVHVRNLVARLMYALAQDGGEADDSADTTGVLIAPTTIRIEAKRTKGNRYGRRANRWIEITFHPGGAITWDLDAKAVDMPFWQKVAAVLTDAAPEAMTPEAITKAVNEDYPGDTDMKVNRVRAALSQHPDDFVVVDESTRPKTWSIRGSRTHTSPSLGGRAYVRSTPHNPAHSVQSVSAQSNAQSASVSAQSSAQMGAEGGEAVSAQSFERGAHSLPCGHDLPDGQRVWADGEPTGVIRCRQCGHEHVEDAVLDEPVA